MNYANANEYVFGGKMPKTNADKIRAMTDEELAEFASYYVGCGYCDAGTISGDCSAHCKENLLKWLQSKAE